MKSEARVTLQGDIPQAQRIALQQLRSTPLLTELRLVALPGSQWSARLRLGELVVVSRWLPLRRPWPSELTLLSSCCLSREARCSSCEDFFRGLRGLTELHWLGKREEREVLELLELWASVSNDPLSSLLYAPALLDLLRQIGHTYSTGRDFYSD